LSPVDDGAAYWLRFAHITDPQLADEESPARVVRLDGLIPASWRPHEVYAPHVLDATVGVINTLHEQGRAAGRPVDFVLLTGDLVELGQANELRWFLDIMDGKPVRPDSGTPDPAPIGLPDTLNPKGLFDAEGLDPDIPWYTTYGNHDGLSVGNFRIWRGADNPVFWHAPLLPPVAGLAGLHRLSPFLNSLIPTLTESPAVLPAGPNAINGQTLQLRPDALSAGSISGDAGRHFLSRRRFIAAHFETGTGPPGHGFTMANVASGTAWYSFRPAADVPIRIIVLDTVPDRPPYALPIFYGVLSRKQFRDFLKPEVEAAQSRNELVIIASHHPPSDFRLPFPRPHVRTGEFRRYLAAQDNVILHLIGHPHRNRVRLIEGEHSYIEMETSGLIDYPQEGRLLDIRYDGSTGEVRVESTMFSHLDNPTPLSEEGFRRAAIDAGRAQDAAAKRKGAALDRLFSEGFELYGPGYDVKGMASRPLTKGEMAGTANDRNVAITLQTRTGP